MSSQINPLEILHVTSKKVSCQGEKVGVKLNSGHPLVYLDMGKNDFVICPYCSKYFTVKKNTHNPALELNKTKLSNKND